MRSPRRGDDGGQTVHGTDTHSAHGTTTLAPRAAERAADFCPACSTPLGTQRGRSRRQIVFSATRGVFTWRCPECAVVWTDVRAG